MFYNPIGFRTLTLREIKRFMKVYLQTIFAPLLSNMLFLGIFGASLKNRQIGIEGVDYLHFLIPGLCALGAIMNAYQNPSSSLIIQRYQNLIQDLNSYPISTFEKLAAYIISGTFRGTLIGVLTFFASIPFLGFIVYSPLLFLMSLIIISAIFSALGLISGLVIKSFDGIAFISSFVMTPLIYFGGVFFQITTLPEIYKKIALLNPMSPLIDFVRFSFLNTELIHPLYDLLSISAFLIISLSVAYYLLKKGRGLTE